MAIKSNFYLDKIGAEHPTASYSLSNDFHTKSNVYLEYFSSTDNGKIITEYSGNNNFGYIKSDVVTTKIAPIVSGSEYALYFSGSNKTVVLPNQGFLNYNGRYGQYTLEFWTKIERPYEGKRKIVGSLTDDNNGLYVNQTSLVLQLGNKSISSYVKDFNRPLLIQLTYSSEIINLIINGELINSLSLDDTDLALLSSSNYLVFGQGTYDCISIFCYKTDIDLAKRRFNYGQAVQFKDETITLYGGDSLVADYSKSNYAVNYVYPISTPWSVNKNDNLDLDTNSSYVMSYRYSLPTFNSNSTATSPGLTSTTFNLKPATAPLQTANSNLKIDSLKMLKGQTKAFYIHGYYSALPASEQILFKVTNTSNDYFIISVNGSTISFKLKYGASNEVTVLTDTGNNLALNASKYNFIIGIDMAKFSTYCSQIGYFDVANLFSNPESLTVFIGGDNDTTLTTSKTCNAEIYSVKFLTQDNLSKRSLLIDSTKGIFIYPTAINTSPTGSEATQNNILGSYDLRVYVDKFNYSTNTNKLSVATNGYMKINVPLSFLCKQINSSTYSFDFLQFNYSYESPIMINSSDTSKFDTTDKNETSVRSYITFETLNDDTKLDSAFTTTVLPNLNRVVDARTDTNWSTTKYEIADNFVIYPPNSITLSDHAAVIHLDFDVFDTTNNRIEIQKMSLTSMALDSTTTETNPVGTKYGTNIIPYTYTLSGGNRVYNYKNYNPFVICKNDNPHLYLSRDSGIRLVGTSTAGTYRGIKLPIADDTSIGFMQMSIFYDAPYEQSTYYAKFPSSTEQIFEIQTATRNIKFNLTRTGSNGDTATISSTETAGTNYNITYYLNGEATASPSISTNKWYTLGIAFTTPLAFSGGTGEFDLVGFISLDNLSYYNTSSIPSNFYSMFTSTNKILDEENMFKSIVLDYDKYKYHYQEDSIKVRKSYIIS